MIWWAQTRWLAKGRSIVVLKVGKCFCDKAFNGRRRTPRCQRGVARNGRCSHRCPAGGADFEGGSITSHAGLLLLRPRIGLIERFATCFVDGRISDRAVPDVSTMVGPQRSDRRRLAFDDFGLSNGAAFRLAHARLSR